MYDLLTNKKISGFSKKDAEFMLFQNRSNMLEYFKKNPDNASNIIYSLFENRKKQKKLIYAPRTVELRTSILPTVHLLEKLNISYDDLCSRLDLIKICNYNCAPLFEEQKNTEIWIDSRERDPILFDGVVERKKLTFGDYCCVSNFTNTYIERKTINDLVSTVSQHYDRFLREFVRAKENEAKIIVMIEIPLTKAISFNYLPQMKWSQASPEFIFNRIRQICQEFQNVQFLFCDGRNEMKRIMIKLFGYQDDISKLDLQYLYDKKLL